MKKADKDNLARCAREVREIADLLLAKLEFMEKKLSGPAERTRLARRMAELDAALDGLAKRGVITPEQAEQAKRRVAEGGAA